MVPPSHQEQLHVLRYAVGQQYKARPSDRPLPQLNSSRFVPGPTSMIPSWCSS